MIPGQPLFYIVIITDVPTPSNSKSGGFTFFNVFICTINIGTDMVGLTSLEFF